MLEFLPYISYSLNGIGLLLLGWYVVRSMQYRVRGKVFNSTDLLVTREVQLNLGPDLTNLYPGDVLKPHGSDYQLFSKLYEDRRIIPRSHVSDYWVIGLWRFRALEAFIKALGVRVPKNSPVPPGGISNQFFSTSLRLLIEATYPNAESALPRNQRTQDLDGPADQTAAPDFHLSTYVWVEQVRRMIERESASEPEPPEPAPPRKSAFERLVEDDLV